jgi:predicted Zn-dependent protease
MLLLSAASSLVALAQTTATPPAADAFRNEALVIERSATTIRMHADGTGEREVHVWLRVQSEGAAQQFGVLSFGYASVSETPTISLVRVHKPDGATVDTPAADAIEMPAAVTRDAPLYSDLKEQHLPVRSLSAGDTLEYDFHTTIDKAEAPGQFWGTAHFTPPGTVIVLAEVLTLEVPKDKYVQVWSPHHTPEVTEHDGLRSYRWNVAQLVAAPKKSGQGDESADAPKDPDVDADGRSLPSVAWTTFHNWAEVGDWYRGLALERAQSNDALRARAEEITKDAKTPEDQVQAIYSFVSARMRYVGIDFGVGRYQPHAAAEVLSNGYGDCKDKDTLLEALLHAKGFHTAPALVGVGIAPVSDVPSPAVFNHVITTVNLPSGRIWLDSTAEVGPYRFLSAPIRDQLALLVPADAPAALELTPAAAPYPFIARFEATGTLDAQGKLTSHITATYRTDDEPIVRALARSVAPADLNKASQYIASNTGFSGTTSNTSFKNSDDLSSPIVLTYDYEHHPYGDWENRRIVPALPALEFSALASDSSAPSMDIQLGAPRTLIAISRIHLPEGYGADLPDPVHVKTDFATFDKTYRFDGNEIAVERNIVVLKDKLPKAEWKQYQAFTKDINLDGEPWIQLIRPKATSVLAPPPPSPGKNSGQPGSASSEVPVQGPPSSGSDATGNQPSLPENVSARELVQAAFGQIRSGDLNGATATLDKVKAKNPNEQYLWAGYGAIAAAQKKYDDVKADYTKELAAYPENAGAVAALAGAENSLGDSAGARHTIQGYLDRHPEDVRLSLYLASLETAADDNAGALKTLETVADRNPDDRSVRVRLSETLVRLDRKDEAAAAAKSALAGTDDTELLNDAAYVLAETGLDLPYAEEASRRSIHDLEEKSAAISTAEVNSHAFAQANLLIASWDTLGWILFRENKLDEAKPLVLAGWRNALIPEEGDHLGQIDEAMGKKEDAISAYLMAAVAIQGNNVPPAVRQHITESIARLKGAGIQTPSAVGAQTLQDLRTYKIARPEGVSGWGTFRLQIDTTGVIASQQMSGEQKLANITEAINAMKFPDLLPPQSKAHLLRSAVVSCSVGNTCELVLVPRSNLYTERQ